MNVVVIIIMTSVVGGIGYLTANFSTVYLLCFPLLLPLYKKYKFDREAAFMLCQTACAVVGFLPWGIGVAVTAASSGLDVMELSSAAMPWGLCVIPVIIIQWIYFSYLHKKQYGTLGLIENREALVEEATESENKPNARPQYFSINLIIFIVAMVCLTVIQLPAYLIFIFASILTSLINYRTNFSELWNKVSGLFFNSIIMLLAISVYLAIFNYIPEGGVSMITAVSELLVSLIPGMLLKYIHVIFLLLCVIIIRFIPYQVFNAMYPLFISIGSSFGIPAVYVIAPFVCNLTFATSCTPFNTATYIGANLLQMTEEETNHYIKRSVPIMTVFNALVVLIAWVTGVLVI